ncbi:MULTISPECIES: ribosomal protein S18-alanine N-acetyltransferase [unclassified Roseateles]|uniref:ribosomal protein S18-alanine N-acetyltransferase n=1 Tax=unclassified Roseateles TaxID=2626991 RepID=UPI0006F42698|nr:MULTISPECIES: ribosomal protein S18-alanine N-acetyltransferase [unclassified Roseateles]KQW46188.1 ribosomal-protein-alanine acetyltransferase [Pelomonas sp. Root405]KRA73237.1 ribosomal-protein-alanine acetyltransferase [Pelomonas sp. Root662]
MSALLERNLPPFEAAAMRVPDLTEIIAVERQAYPVPWTHGNFVDSLAAGYPAEVLRGSRAELLGYWVAMPGLDEMHLLNITVVPAWQGRGLAVAMLDRLVADCRRRGLTQLWLEVRVGNERAREIYGRYGFVEVGRRRAYYPVPHGPREDALLMSLVVAS